MAHHTLLQDALTRHTAKMHLSNSGSGNGIYSDSDDDMVETPVITPNFSRATSPTPLSPKLQPTTTVQPAGSRATPKKHKSPSKRKTGPVGSKVLDPNSKDPLRRFPTEVNIQIFRNLNVTDLLTTVRVCKRWKRSATINWCFFRHFQHAAYEDSPDESEIERYGPEMIKTQMSTHPTWTRKEAREDWRKRFLSIVRRDDLEIEDAQEADTERARKEGWRTPKELQEEKWKAEEEAEQKPSKQELRAYYKSLANPKVKSKGSGTSSPRCPRDVTAYDPYEYESE